MYYVYILESLKNGSFYKGCTDNLKRRLNEHNAGKEIATSRYAPWILRWSCIKLTLKEARALEKKLKNITSRIRIEAFISKYSGSGPDAPAGGLDADR